MKHPKLSLIAAATLFCLPLFGQQDAPKKGSAENSVMVTGCLAQGTGASDYSLRDENGRTFDLQSTSVNLKPHIGHKVTITGAVEEGAAPARSKAGESSQNLELRVTNLKMVSTTCP